MYLDLYSKDGHRYIRISESVRVKKNGTRVTRKKVIKNIGPVSRYDDGKPNFEQRLRDSFKGGCIVNRVNGNNLQYKIKGDNKS